MSKNGFKYRKIRKLLTPRIFYSAKWRLTLKDNLNIEAMLEQFRQYEIKDTRKIFGNSYGDPPDLENQFTLDCPGAPTPILYPTSGGTAWCLPTDPNTTGV